ncbi:Hypothetical protein SMAX5B_011408 [Scophthalmus maximus]|uniref:Uncharacterized protein n=1 Tax=Scophthalmus maximus TaxID=52904 RepID=A0A2U9BP03_SCOMX|nr:Hypothetical protein SMAX5B_011408 [Scophthalmus maximus]
MAINNFVIIAEGVLLGRHRRQECEVAQCSSLLVCWALGRERSRSLAPQQGMAAPSCVRR